MRKPRHVVVAAAAGLFFLPSLQACSPMQPDLSRADEQPDTPTQAAVTGEPLELGPGLQRLAEMAKSDLVTKLGVDRQGIQVVEAEYVTWRDSSIGCPRTDMQYMQVLTNGARLLLRANGVLYHYHSGGNRAPFLCTTPAPNGPLPYAPGEA